MCESPWQQQDCWGVGRADRTEEEANWQHGTPLASRRAPPSWRPSADSGLSTLFCIPAFLLAMPAFCIHLPDPATHSVRSSRRPLAQQPQLLHGRVNGCLQRGSKLVKTQASVIRSAVCCAAASCLKMVNRRAATAPAEHLPAAGNSPASGAECVRCRSPCCRSQVVSACRKASLAAPCQTRCPA